MNLTREELLKRGARLKDGTPLAEKVATIPKAPLVEAPTIDTTPIAEAVSQLSAVVKTALEAQRLILEKIVEQQSQPVEPRKAPETWEFKIVRDSKGRMESLTAKAIS